MFFAVYCDVVICSCRKLLFISVDAGGTAARAFMVKDFQKIKRTSYFYFGPFVTRWQHYGVEESLRSSDEYHGGTPWMNSESLRDVTPPSHRDTPAAWDLPPRD